jgi:Ca2+-binding RTX toxin-like protein
MTDYRGTPASETIDPQSTSDDYIFADEGHDTVYGWEGHDFLVGWGGDDTLFGEMGNDTLWAGNGNDLLIGGDGNDELAGWNDNDTLIGGRGNDTLYGENGNDHVDGGGGYNSLNGGSGSDIFVVSTSSYSYIADFEDGVDVIKGVDFNSVKIYQLGDSTFITNMTGAVAYAALANVDASLITAADFIA